MTRTTIQRDILEEPERLEHHFLEIAGASNRVIILVYYPVLDVATEAVRVEFSRRTACQRAVVVRMSNQEQDLAFVRSLRILQENLRKSGPAVVVGYMLIASILICGGIGFALDRWLGTSPWFLIGALLFGIAVGFFELARIIWRQ